jgi:hypothetical protein
VSGSSPTTGRTIAVAAPDQWRAPIHDHGDIKVDVSAVGPWMTMAGEADGVHVHPLYSVQYRAAPDPSRARGAAKAGRAVGRGLVDPRLHRPGRHRRGPSAAHPACSHADRVLRLDDELRCQFDDLGFDGTSAKLTERLKAGDSTASLRRSPTRCSTRSRSSDVDVADEIIDRYR